MAPVSMADIKYLRIFVDDLVVQGRDHAAAHIYIYLLSFSEPSYSQIYFS